MYFLQPFYDFMPIFMLLITLQDMALYKKFYRLIDSVID